MSNIVIILGESGTGKSSAIRTLNSTETFIINILNKPLPFKGYKNKYNADQKNILESDDYSEVIKYLQAINVRRPEIKTIILDDFSFLMNNEFMRRCRERGYDKFVEMGYNVFALLEICKQFRSDLICYLICHTEKDHSGIIKPKTVGKMTGDYVGLSERVSIVLHSVIMDGQYKFLTQNDGICVAKSPMDMFSDLYIPNDLAYVNEQIKNYYNEGE